MERRSIRRCGKGGWRPCKSLASVGRMRLPGADRLSPRPTREAAVSFLDSAIQCAIPRNCVLPSPVMGLAKLQAYPRLRQTLAGNAIEDPQCQKDQQRNFWTR